MRLIGARAIFQVAARLGFLVLVLEIASLLAKPLDVSFRLFPRWVDVFANLGDALILACWFYINDETLLVGGANDPPICERRKGKGGQESAQHDNPKYTPGGVQ
jgi:hypothetical protein